MSQVRIYSNIKVECEPQIDYLSFLRPSKSVVDRSNALHKEAERIRDEIRRHCDDANPRIVYTTVLACEFCGDESDWQGEPVTCCNEAVKENETKEPS